MPPPRKRPSASRKRPAAAGCSDPPHKKPAAATSEVAPAVSELKQWVVAEGLTAPKPPKDYATVLLNRQDACDAVKGYINDVHSNKQPKDGKFPLIGCSGMKGIGKSTLLVHSAQNLVPDGAKGLYLTFNGGGAHKEEFEKSLGHQGERKDRAVAFGHMLLTACGVPLRSVLQLDFHECLDVYRSLVDLSGDSFVVFFLDEIGDLGDDESMETMKALMGKMDKYPGQLAFVFAHIQEDILNKGATKSGREVISLWLPALEISAWKQLARDDWLVAADKFPQIHQLLLACCGHPRSLVDGLPAALTKEPTLLSQPNECSLVLAMDAIVRTCKFGEFNKSYLNKMVPQWFDFVDNMDTSVLARDGLLLKVQDDVELLQPLLLHHWASQNSQVHSIPFHLHQAYAADAIVGHDTEKRMEAIMFNYEALLKKCVGPKHFTLHGFYCSKHTGCSFCNRTVKALLPPQVNLVHAVDNFNDIQNVLHYLNQGFIVVSKAHSEVGIEYLSPFVCVESGKLVVAAVQCKFVEKSCKWGPMGKTMEQAIGALRLQSVLAFPVFYTTADQDIIRNPTYSNSDGIYFTESDLFTFTKKMGILRLHVMKSGKKLQEKHLWLRHSSGTTR